MLVFIPRKAAYGSTVGACVCESGSFCNGLVVTDVRLAGATFEMLLKSKKLELLFFGFGELDISN